MSLENLAAIKPVESFGQHWSNTPELNTLLIGTFREVPGYRVLRAHGTSDWLLIATLDGHGCFRLGEIRLDVQAGDVALVRPGTPHDYGTAPGADFWEILWVHFRPRAEWLEWLAWPEAAPGLMALSLAESPLRASVIQAFWQVHRAAASGLRRREAFAVSALETLLLWCDAANPRSPLASYDPRIQRAVEYLNARLAEPVSLADIAAACGLSPSRCAHLFREQVGVPPLRFLDQLRVRQACLRLAYSARPASRIAQEVGIDPVYFPNWFKRRVGMTSGEFRRRGGGH